jgi:hypothetical protein
MALLGKKDILGCNDIPTDVVEVPQWGGHVKVRGMTAGERDKFEEMIRTQGLNALRATVAGMCIIDEDGKRLFTDLEITKLGEKSAEALDVVVEVASRLSGLTPEDADFLEKN